MIKLTTKNTQSALNPIFNRFNFEAKVTCDASSIDQFENITIVVKIHSKENPLYSPLAEVKLYVNNDEGSDVSISVELSKITSRDMMYLAKELSALSMLLLAIDTAEVHAAAKADALIAFESTNEARTKTENNLRKTHRQLDEAAAKEIIHYVAGRTRELRGNLKFNVAHGQIAKVSFTALVMNKNGEIRNKSIQAECNKRLAWSSNFEHKTQKELIDMLTGMWIAQDINYEEVEAILFS